MKNRKFFVIFSLLLAIVLTFSSCSKGTASVESSDHVMKMEATSVTTTAPETTTTTQTSLETTTTTPAPTTTTPLPETIMITTTPPPVTQPTDKASEVIVMSAAQLATVSSPAASLTTTVTTAAPSAPIQQKLTPLTTTYSYNNLPSDQKVVYNKILSSIKSRAEIISFDTPTSLEVVRQIYTLIFTDEINIQYISETFKYDSDPVRKMQLIYTLSSEEVSIINSETEAKANEIIAKITPTMTTFDIIRYFHDTIIKNCTYDDQAPYAAYAYGALVQGRALCQGYAHAMALLCNKVGIENAFAMGYAGEAHMWNKIKLNGSWYNMDVTWDDPDNASTPGLVLYNYFNVTDAQLSARQFYTNYVPIPEATAADANYFVYKSLRADSVEKAQQILYSEYIRAVNAKEQYVFIQCTDAQVYSDVVNALVSNQGVFSVMAQAKTQTAVPFNAGTTNLIRDDEMFTLCFVISYE